MNERPSAAETWPKSPLRVGLWVGLAAAFVAPFAAMRFTSDIAWTGFDFAMAALLLGVLGLGVEAVARAPVRLWAKVAGALALMLVAALIWAQGAVGIV